MTRQHFAAFAETLRNRSPRVRLANGECAFGIETDEYALQTLQWERDVRAVAETCARFNGAFKYETFYRAAGYSVRPDGSLYAVSGSAR